MSPVPKIAQAGWKCQDWTALVIVLASATIMRVAFFNGFFGSDDTVYLERSIAVAHSDWSSSDYNGALRYGFNIPAGLLIAWMGVGTWTANLWPLLCSLGEIATVYVFAHRYAGRRVAVFSSMILATIPLHIAVATRIHADPVVSLFLTLSFVFFYAAESARTLKLFFATGLSMGMVFWVKELAIVTLFGFFSYPPIYRRFDGRWVFVILGGLSMFAAHLALMQYVASDPLHLIKTVAGQVQKSFITQNLGEDGAGFYFHYLFLDPKHTWLAPYLAVCGCVAAAVQCNGVASANRMQRYSVWWLLVLIGMLTFMPVSLSPLRLTMKQPNYMTLFLAPIALLAGQQLARWHARTILLAVVVGGIVLGALEQRAYRVFTGNARAAVAFAIQHPDDWVLGTANTNNFITLSRSLGMAPLPSAQYGFLLRAPSADNPALAAVMDTQPFGFAIFDRETIAFDFHGANTLAEVPPCWQPVKILTPLDDDLSRRLVEGFLRVATAVSGPTATVIAGKLLPLLEPLPATVYRVDARDLLCNGP
jgi:hypothetical protein